MGTVSGVLNGRLDQAPETVAKVRALIRETGFKPRRYKNRPDVVGFRQFALLHPESQGAISASTTHLAQKLAQGADEVFAECNDQLIVTQMTGDGKLPRCLIKQKFSGLIIRGGDFPDVLFEKLRGIPSVWAFSIKAAPEDLDNVGVDNIQVAAMAARMIRNSGAKRALLLQHDDTFNLELVVRNCVCENILRTRSFPVDFVSLADLGTAISAHDRHSTAVFVPGHDPQSVAAYQILQEQGHKPCVKAPLVCVTANPGLLAAIDPNITAIFIEPMEIGKAAARQLLWRISHFS